VGIRRPRRHRCDAAATPVRSLESEAPGGGESRCQPDSLTLNSANVQPKTERVVYDGNGVVFEIAPYRNCALSMDSCATSLLRPRMAALNAAWAVPRSFSFSTGRSTS